MSDLRRRMRPLLGTFVEIGIPAASPAADAIIDGAFNRIELVQACLNRHDPQSELSRLNRDGSLEQSSLVIRSVLRLSREMMSLSGGLFDCTFGSPHAGRAEDIEIDGRSIRLHREVRITLDGIAKGYAVDRAIKNLRRAGVTKGYVNAGGDLRIFGDLTLPVWRREADDSYRMIGRLKDAALASSRVSRDPMESFTGHISHRGGLVAEVGVWSVLAPSAWRADALTKVACLCPVSERQTRVESLRGVVLQTDAAL
jgi:thiamine biosynthesis lipoprotein